MRRTARGTSCGPVTVFRNKVTIDDLDSKFALITWGAAQLGVGQGVLDAVADGLLAPEQIDEIVLLAVVWVDPAAHDETAVRLANREACAPRSPTPSRSPTRTILRTCSGSARRGRNAFYSGD